jgi:hypothetical protein
MKVQGGCGQPVEGRVHLGGARSIVTIDPPPVGLHECGRKHATGDGAEDDSSDGLGSPLDRAGHVIDAVFAHEGGTSIAFESVEQLALVLGVLEEFRDRDQATFSKAARVEMPFERIEHPFIGAQEEVVGVLEVRVKGRSRDPRAVEHLLHGDLVERVLHHEVGERCAEGEARARRSRLRFGREGDPNSSARFVHFRRS